MLVKDRLNTSIPAVIKKPMTLGDRLELCASALHPVAMTRRLVETRLLGTVLLSASTHSDEANRWRSLVVFATYVKKQKTNLPRQYITALLSLR